VRSLFACEAIVRCSIALDFAGAAWDKAAACGHPRPASRGLGHPVASSPRPLAGGTV